MIFMGRKTAVEPAFLPMLFVFPIVHLFGTPGTAALWPRGILKRDIAVFACNH